MSETPAIRYLSLGWGVQSFTIAAMCALGELEGLDVAVHADTTHEAEATYDFARRWTPWLGERGVRVETVGASNNGELASDLGATILDQARAVADVVRGPIRLAAARSVVPVGAHSPQEASAVGAGRPGRIDLVNF